MFKKLKQIFLTIFGDIKIYEFPMFIIYNPSTFKIKGYDTRKALDILEPGDIVLRKYIHYLDGYFIPGKFSHSSIYVGNGQIIHAVADGVEYIDVIDFLRCDSFCIMRPKKKEEIAPAIEFAKAAEQRKAEYDFDFAPGNNAYYCHELVATAYKNMNIEMKPITMFKIFKLKPRYIAESFTENENFEKVLEIL